MKVSLPVWARTPPFSVSPAELSSDPGDVVLEFVRICPVAFVHAVAYVPLAPVGEVGENWTLLVSSTPDDLSPVMFALIA